MLLLRTSSRASAQGAEPRPARSPSRAAPSRVARILVALAQARPSGLIELTHRSPFELLVATILSAQCTDKRVNEVTPVLFRRYPEPRDFADAKVSELEQIIRSTGFFKAKTRNVIACARQLTERFNGQVPRTMDELVTLPGVGRKTANVVLGHAVAAPAVIVDTHVIRVSERLGLSRSSDPEQIEKDLQRMIPRPQWTTASQQLLLHGRYVCTARRPTCSRCVIYRECAWKGKPRL